MGYKQAEESILDFRIHVVNRVLRDDDIELPNVVVRFESSRRGSIDEAVLACTAVHKKSVLLRVNRTIKRMRKRTLNQIRKRFRF